MGKPRAIGKTMKFQPLGKRTKTNVRAGLIRAGYFDIRYSGTEKGFYINKGA